MCTLPYLPVERPPAILDVDLGASLLAVPDPFRTLELSDAPGKCYCGAKHCTTILCFDIDIL